MATALRYTILPGDTYSRIASGIDACQGVTAQQIEAANPGIPPTNLQPGQLLAIPGSAAGVVALRYTVQAGDTYNLIASHLAECAGVTYQQIEAANPGIPPNGLQVGQVIAIPATGAQPQPDPQPIEADTIGYWDWTWSPSAAPPGATLGIAFSGYTNPADAISNSANVMGSLVGAKYISLGGGNAAGAYDASSFAPINAAIAGGQFAGYDGVAFDVEEGASGLQAAFAQTFALCRTNGFRVLVTVSHSAPYGIADAKALMDSFFADPNIDFLSPQLYTTGNETSNDWATSGGVTWSSYATAKALVVPSIVSSNLYPNAQTTFATYGVTTAGFIRWGRN